MNYAKDFICFLVIDRAKSYVGLLDDDNSDPKLSFGRSILY